MFRRKLCGVTCSETRCYGQQLGVAITVGNQQYVVWSERWQHLLCCSLCRFISSNLWCCYFDDRSSARRDVLAPMSSCFTERLSACPSVRQSVCLSVRLSVCLLASSSRESYWSDLHPEIYLWTKKNWLNFGSHPDLRIFQHCEVGHFPTMGLMYPGLLLRPDIVRPRPRPRPDSARPRSRPRPRPRPKICYETETKNYETETSPVKSIADESNTNQ